jgi:hypothetical protein
MQILFNQRSGTTSNQCAPKIFLKDIRIVPYPYSKYELVLYITGLNEIPSKVFNDSKSCIRGALKIFLRVDQMIHCKRKLKLWDVPTLGCTYIGTHPQLITYLQ